MRITQGMKSKTPLIAALAYAEAGWPILPIWWIKNGKYACGDKACSIAYIRSEINAWMKEKITRRDSIA